jgi:hypothetical protein
MATTSAILGLADQAVTSAVAAAEKAANDALNAIEDKIEQVLYPKTYRYKQRRAQYLGALNSLLKQAQDAAAASDYVSAYAIAKSAENLANMPPYSSWSSIADNKTQGTAEAAALAQAYFGKAGMQADSGIGGTYKAAAGISPALIVGAGILAAVLLRRKS